MKLPREWDESDILAHITNGVKENIGLDYKSRDSLQKTDGKKNEVGKDVSAFANSAGGVIIYGMAEDGHLPTGIDGGFDPSDITKEWLEQVINSHVQRRPEGVYINQVELVNTYPGRVLYVVEVSQATTRAPHQASDKKYYKRRNFISEPMEDYEVRDAMRRQLGPDLGLRLHVASQTIVAGIVGVLVTALVENVGYVEAKYVTIVCRVTSGEYSLWFDMMPNDTRVLRTDEYWVVPGQTPAHCYYETGTRHLVYPDLPLRCPPLALAYKTSRTTYPTEYVSLEFSLHAEGMRGKRLTASFMPEAMDQDIEAHEIPA